MAEAYAVIMAGGRGERFWPLSTSRRPKQLLDIVGGRSFLAQSVDRVAGLISPERIFVVTNADLVDGCRAAVPALPPGNVIGEPVGRDTAAAVALGCVLVEHAAPDGVFCVLTADQVISDVERFRKTLAAALDAAGADDILVTMGIEPRGPATCYGYIEADEPYGVSGDVSFLRARRFVEKPDADTACAYVRSGRYFWNSGMFVWSVASVRNAFAAHAPNLLGMMDRLAGDAGGSRFMDAVATEYADLEKISVDYALMEKSDNIVMARGTFDWDDVGSWPALENHLAPDQDGNFVIGRAQGLDAHGNIVVSDQRLTALIGVEDLVVVQSGGVTLVCAKDRSQEVKTLLRRLAEDPDCRDLL